MLPTVGIGRWTTIYGGKTVANATSPTSTITVVPGGFYHIALDCYQRHLCASTNDITLVSYPRQPTTANAGLIRKLCNVTSFTLAANTPTIGTGRWTTIYGGKTVTNATSPTSTITVVPGDSIILRWTVTNGTCAASTNDVTLVSYVQPAAADAGADQQHCEVPSFTLAGSAPSPASAVGTWTVVAVTGTTAANIIIADDNLRNTTVTVPNGATATLRWTITNGNCTSIPDDVVLINNAAPSAAVAGPDQKQCNATSFTLAATAPAVGTGRWVTLYGGKTVANPNSANTTITVVPGDSIVLRWLTSNGFCASPSDTLVLVSYEQPTTAVGLVLTRNYVMSHHLH